MTHLTQYSDKWTKIGVNIGICLGNNQGYFQLHSFTRRENAAKSFRGATFFWLTLYLV